MPSVTRWYYPLNSRLPKLTLFCLLAGFLIASCSQWLGFPAYYDATTYKNLTDLKPQVLMLYETFKTNEIDQDRIDTIRLKLAQIYEYEKGKGEKNRETTAQIGIIQNMFERHVKDREENGIWSEIHTQNVKTNIGEAFDIAISTENLKNKNE